MTEYIVFTDESNYNKARYRGLSAFSMPREQWESVNGQLETIIQESDVSDFKWSKIRNHKYAICAKRILMWILNNLKACNLRIDTLIWDTYDSRHKLQSRDDLANYERMFFHLLKFTLKKRPKNARWHIRPDELGGIDWETIQNCLMNAGKLQEIHENTFFGELINDPSYSVLTFEQKSSKDTYPIQVADLFCGMASFSWNEFETYKQWLTRDQEVMFADLKTTAALSQSQQYKHQTLQAFYKNCKKRSLGISLQSSAGLKTHIGKYPVNFWFYTPQGSYDKAPKRKKTK